MRLAWRRLEKQEIDHELLWLGVSLTGFVLAAVWLSLGLPWPICLFHALTGEPCLTCGATRSAIACAHADFFTALKWNPLVFVACCSIALFDAYAVVVLSMGARRLRADFSVAEKRALRVFAIIILLANWSYLLTHASKFNS